VNPLLQLKALGQSPWLDYIQRAMLADGELQRLVNEDGICGVTSNPTILARAILEHDDYRAAIARLQPRCRDTIALYEAVAIEDIRMAADQLASVYERTNRLDGYVSLEVSPDLAYDSDTSIHEARRLWAAIDRPNVMIKIPATRPGLDAIRELIARGININATLIFSPSRYRDVATAWQEGLARRKAAGQAIEPVASVASFFVSRIETLADQRLEELAATQTAARQLQGRVAIAAAKSCYQVFRTLQEQPAWQALLADGAHPQRLLWASTSTKNPAYSDVKYVEELIGPQTVTTLPPETLDAYRDHGQPALRLESELDEAQHVLTQLEALGLDYEQLAAQLEQEGVEKFQASYRQLLAALERQG
jgi:transaldolase